MPLTFPSHAAAILPLTHRRFGVLPPVALVVGSAAPDLGYLLRVGGSHAWTGLWKVTLLAGLGWLWVEWLLLPLLRRMLPRRPVALAERLSTRGLPRTLTGLFWGILALALGAATHLLWDGLTHDGLWPARVLYPDVEGIGGLTVARMVQHLSTLLGGALVLAVWWRCTARDEVALPIAAHPGWRALAVVVLLSAMGLQAFRELRWLHPSTSLEVWLWNAFWSSARGGAVALTGIALLDRWMAATGRSCEGRPWSQVEGRNQTRPSDGA